MNTYNLESVEMLISNYLELGGDMIEIEEGVLGLGKILLHSAPKKCTIIITEKYVSSWSSTHTVRQYRKTPKKYQNIIDNQNK